MAGRIDNRVQPPVPTTIVQAEGVTTPAPPPNTVPQRTVSPTEAQVSNPAQPYGIGGAVNSAA